jgi:LAO/AO transport system kinase
MPADLARRLLARDRNAVPEALNLVDDERPAGRLRSRALLDELQRHRAELVAVRVGITGAPGVGKSTLLDAIVRVLRAADRSVGILAIDPSSQQTGGALLGDRFRVRSGAGDDGVYLRSMAARTRLGGLADATGASLDILSAVFDCVFVETVGVGQSEGEIAELVDSLVFVAQPGAGDTLQFMKAGILELPDIFVVNKADLGAVAQRTLHELSAGLGLTTTRSDGWQRPVILASARDGVGIEELIAATDAHRAHLERSGELPERRQRGRVSGVLDCLSRRFGSYGLEQMGGAEALALRVREAGTESLSSLVEDLGREIEDALRKPSSSSS